jgi:hypothetical protein
MDTYDRTICFMYALQYGYICYLFNSCNPCTEQDRPPMVVTLVHECYPTRASGELMFPS